MKPFIYLCLSFLLSAENTLGQFIQYDQTREGFLVFHPIKFDKAGKIIPWNNPDIARSYDEIVNLTYNFWDTMKLDINGLPYYMNHQVWWKDGNDPRGLGGDQLAMALSSFQLMYMYTGNEKIKEKMKFIAEYYLLNGLSPQNASWSDIPYPYNSFVYGGKYDGDMVLGKNFTQPDKAGSFAWELLKLYKMCKKRRFGHANEDLYLEYAVRIANALASKTTDGDTDNSPLPFRVNALTGEIGLLKDNEGKGKVIAKSSYSTNWSGALNLFENLIKLKAGDTSAYKSAHTKILNWSKKYPVKTNRWGPFFEDVPGWSDTQINAITFAQYMMEHPQYFPDWKTEVKQIFNWVYEKLGNSQWQKYGVMAINEQTAYQTPGNSHTSRQGCAELQYAMLSGDSTMKDAAIRKLNWATYMVDNDGKNCYPKDEVWLTDGYGDYIRHYLRAMATFPELTLPQNRILSSSDIIVQVDYSPDFRKRLGQYMSDEELKTLQISYRTFQDISSEKIRMAKKPTKVTVDKKLIWESNYLISNTWRWTPSSKGGILEINKVGEEVKIF
ncbi:MAG TPA: hypothetical protein VF691_18195 [Cytophagaceae bacterium]|jgi:hypothetical protein